MTTLTEFLHARIADDEAEARVFDWATPDKYYLDGLAHSGEYVCIEVSPARVLAECAAKRRIVEECESFRGGMALLTAVHLLASVYADHPDYQPAWSIDATASP